MVVVQQRRRFLLVRQHYLIALVLLVVLLSLWPLRNARENALVKDSPEVKPRELPPPATDLHGSRRAPTSQLPSQSPSFYETTESSSPKAFAFSSGAPSPVAKSTPDDVKEESLQHPLRFCRHAKLAQLVDDEDDPLEVWYQCQGPQYAAFGQTLARYGDNVTAHGPAWGRRPWIVPTDRHVLLFGNSHTRQIAMTLVCQQLEVFLLDDGVPMIQRTRLFGNSIMRIDFVSRNSSLTIVANAHVAYSPTWQADLEMYVGRSLVVFDAVLLGHVETCEGTSALALELQNLTNHECREYPSVTDWTRAYPGPLLVVSAFSSNRNREARCMVKELQAVHDATGRSNLAFSYGRRYMDAIGLECSSKNKKGIPPGDCRNDTGGQRCTGSQGGHVDLISWDVTEFLQAHLVGATPADDIREGRPHVPTLPMPRRVGTDDSDGSLLFCSDSQIAVPEDAMSDTVDISYQCAGPQYDAFVAAMTNYASNRTQHGVHWGRRRFPVPDNQRILFFGNSHTRQVVKAMACQQMRIGHLESVNHLKAYGGTIFEFGNNATIVSIANSWVPYSSKWMRLLERDLEMTLASFDSIVLGFFNYCGDDNNFSREMESISREKEDVDCRNTPPPSITHVRKRFKGPIAFVTMFDGSRDKDQVEVATLIANLQDPSISFIDARHHSRSMQAACLSPKRFSIHDCREEQHDPETGAILMRHTCCGQLGGMADVVAWDVVEHLYEQLG